MQTLAIDLGASSGKAVSGQFDGERVSIQEVHRFQNIPVQVGDRLHWDILRLFHETKQSILQAKHKGFQKISSMAIDSWAVDFGLLGKNGELLGNPYHYRDAHTAGMMDKVHRRISREDIFNRTGIQFMPINTLYQLYALQEARSPQLECAERLLMIPDLLRYFLTGEQKSESTNASTTQFFHIQQRRWDTELLEDLGLPSTILGEVVEPGTTAGTLLASVSEEVDVSPFPITVVGEHDTASAVVAVPAQEEHFAYLSCGTWSLLGTELDQPNLSRQALDWNFTNEGGVMRTYRLLKNIMGLWLLQECQRTWEKEGQSVTFAEMNQLTVEASPFRSLIDPDDPMFLNPAHMPHQIQAYCRKTNQPMPLAKGELIRCILESLALKYRLVLERTEKLVGHRFSGLHIVGGGIQNTILCQFTANAIQRPVWAGPVEASLLGNVMMQYQALGEVSTLQDIRNVIRRSVPIQQYESRDTEEWEKAYERFISLMGTTESA